MQKTKFTYLFPLIHSLKNKLLQFKRPVTMSPFVLFLVYSVFIVLVANTVFFEKLDAVYPWEDNLPFIVSLILLITSLNILLMVLLNLVIPAKMVVLLLLSIAAVVDYYAVALGVIVDKTMIQNIVETDLAEAKDLINVGLCTRLIFITILPSIFLLYVKVKTDTRLQLLRHQAMSIVSIIVFIPILLAPFSAQYTSFFRLHKPLRYYTNPLFPLYSATSFVADKMSSAKDVSLITRTRHIQKNSSTLKPKLIVVVVGEAVRADHMALNGYPRDTTPNMSQQTGLINFSQVSSCGTSTAVSVPCMFSLSGRSNFDLNAAPHTQNVLDVLASSGVRVSWRDNNSSSKGVADRLPYQSYRSSEYNTICDVECRDIGMLVDLQTHIDQQTQDTLIVLHQMGNHGPAYFKRYPTSFEYFTPACQSNELSDCNQPEIINAYDNALRYTDFFLAQTIKWLKANSAKYNTAMLFVSDHGESLGENGLHLHGMPYAFAPKAQTHVPLISWFSAPYVDIDKTEAHKDQAYSHDDISGALLTLFEVTTDIDDEINAAGALFYLKSKASESADEK
jgi:lipid A ethanolaminephosphotransferase